MMSAAKWNNIYPPGSQVNYYPFDSDNPEIAEEHSQYHIATHTTGKARDTIDGPVVRIAWDGRTVNVSRLRPSGLVIAYGPGDYQPADFIMERKSAGFTLMELAVVLAIVSIVSILAFPTFFNWMARERLRGNVREFAEAVKTERTWAMTNLPTSIVVDEWGYTVARMDAAPVVHEFPEGVTASSNLLRPLVRIDGYGTATFETPIRTRPDGTKYQEPVRVRIGDGKNVFVAEITLGGQSVTTGGAK